jgi:hypothetical protein
LAVGLVLFAAMMLFMAGVFQAFTGLVAIVNDEFYVATQDYLFKFDHRCLCPGRREAPEQTGVLHMGTVRYAVRVRGQSCDAMLVASLEGLEVAMDPVRTVLRGRLTDQAALFGVLAKARLLGLELVEVRRVR